MTNVTVIENKISSLKKYLKILGGLKKYSLKRIQDDVILRGAVERYLYLVFQVTIDLGEAVIALKGFRKPSTYSETFDILCEEGFISAALTKKMVKMVGFRNVVAHDYEKVDFEIIYDVLKNKLGDIAAFVKKVG